MILYDRSEMYLTFFVFSRTFEFSDKAFHSNNFILNVCIFRKHGKAENNVKSFSRWFKSLFSRILQFPLPCLFIWNSIQLHFSVQCPQIINRHSCCLSMKTIQRDMISSPNYNNYINTLAISNYEITRRAYFSRKFTFHYNYISWTENANIYIKSVLFHEKI